MRICPDYKFPGMANLFRQNLVTDAFTYIEEILIPCSLSIAWCFYEVLPQFHYWLALCGQMV